MKRGLDVLVILIAIGVVEILDRVAAERRATAERSPNLRKVERRGSNAYP